MWCQQVHARSSELRQHNEVLIAQPGFSERIVCLHKPRTAAPRPLQSKLVLKRLSATNGQSELGELLVLVLVLLYELKVVFVSWVHSSRVPSRSLSAGLPKKHRLRGRRIQ